MFANIKARDRSMEYVMIWIFTIHIYLHFVTGVSFDDQSVCGVNGVFPVINLTCPGNGLVHIDRVVFKTGSECNSVDSFQCGNALSNGSTGLLPNCTRRGSCSFYITNKPKECTGSVVARVNYMCVAEKLDDICGITVGGNDQKNVFLSTTNYPGLSPFSSTGSCKCSIRGSSITAITVLDMFLKPNEDGSVSTLLIKYYGDGIYNKSSGSSPRIYNDKLTGGYFGTTMDIEFNHQPTQQKLLIEIRGTSIVGSCEQIEQTTTTETTITTSNTSPSDTTSSPTVSSISTASSDASSATLSTTTMSSTTTTKKPSETTTSSTTLSTAPGTSSIRSSTTTTKMPSDTTSSTTLTNTSYMSSIATTEITSSATTTTKTTVSSPTRGSETSTSTPSSLPITTVTPIASTSSTMSPITTPRPNNRDISYGDKNVCKESAEFPTIDITCPGNGLVHIERVTFYAGSACNSMDAFQCGQALTNSSTGLVSPSCNTRGSCSVYILNTPSPCIGSISATVNYRCIGGEPYNICNASFVSESNVYRLFIATPDYPQLTPFNTRGTCNCYINASNITAISVLDMTVNTGQDGERSSLIIKERDDILYISSSVRVNNNRVTFNFTSVINISFDYPSDASQNLWIEVQGTSMAGICTSVSRSTTKSTTYATSKTTSTATTPPTTTTTTTPTTILPTTTITTTPHTTTPPITNAPPTTAPPTTTTPTTTPPTTTPTSTTTTAATTATPIATPPIITTMPTTTPPTTTSRTTTTSTTTPPTTTTPTPTPPTSTTPTTTPHTSTTTTTTSSTTPTTTATPTTTPPTSTTPTTTLHTSTTTTTMPTTTPPTTTTPTTTPPTTTTTQATPLKTTTPTTSKATRTQSTRPVSSPSSIPNVPSTGGTGNGRVTVGVTISGTSMSTNSAQTSNLSTATSQIPGTGSGGGGGVTKSVTESSSSTVVEGHSGVTGELTNPTNQPSEFPERTSQITGPGSGLVTKGVTSSTAAGGQSGVTGGVTQSTNRGQASNIPRTSLLPATEGDTSSPSNFISTPNSGSQVKTGTDIDPLWIILAAILFGLLIMFLVILVLVCMGRRRKSRQSKLDEEDDSDSGTLPFEIPYNSLNGENAMTSDDLIRGYGANGDLAHTGPKPIRGILKRPGGSEVSDVRGGGGLSLVVDPYDPNYASVNRTNNAVANIPSLDVGGGGEEAIYATVNKADKTNKTPPLSIQEPGNSGEPPAQATNPYIITPKKTTITLPGNFAKYGEKELTIYY